MSKKNFIDGLESIFAEDVLEQAFQEDTNPLFSYEARSSTDTDMVSSRGSFSADDDEEEFEYEGPVKKSQVLKRHRKPLSGIDLLIRNTTQDDHSDNPKLHTRKFSLLFDKTVFNKLKDIARFEKVYFRDMVAHVLESFVEKYEKEKGPIE